MKTFFTSTVLLSLLLLAFTACNKDEGESSKQEETLTRSEGALSIDHYWCDGLKISITKLDNKSFLLVRSNDKQALISRLDSIGVKIDPSSFLKYGFGGIEMFSNAASIFDNCEFVSVGVGVDLALTIPEVLYAAPFYRIKGGSEFPMTNIVHVYLKDAGDTKALEKLSKDYNVTIVGYAPTLPNWYIVACTRNSKGNALSVANSFYESTLFAGAEPGFISGELN